MESAVSTEIKWKKNKKKDQENSEKINGDFMFEKKNRIGFKVSKVSSENEIGERERSRIVYLEEDQGIWKCRHCSWTYRLLGSGIKHSEKHHTSCQVVMESRRSAQTQVEPPSSETIAQNGQCNGVSAPPTTVVIPHGDVQIHVRDRSFVESRRENEWEVLKSVVYGGLVESIVSLGVVSSAAGANTSTLNVVSLGLANLIAGFLVMLHELSEIKSSSDPTHQNDDHRSDLYWKLLGRRTNFKFHLTISLISFTLFGLLPPVIYGFSPKHRTEKLVTVASASLICISLLSTGKAHTSEPIKPYAKTLIYYVGLWLTVSGFSYVAGLLIGRFLEQIGSFIEPSMAPSPSSSLELFGADSGLVSW